jgi:TolB-like protein/class 3 adenylate cyclase/tetratricopeptide (TPR) repeat protein
MSDLETKSERRLAAIMVTDIAGYSSLMQSDEAGTFVALGTMRGAAERLVREHRGRIANTAGDSILAEFPSAVDAVHCALALQDMPRHEATATDLRARIGIHLGDVLERNGDLFGTAVNIAARLEAMAEPGGIVVSSAIRDATAGKLPASFADLGMKTLKNIEEPVRVYALSASRPTLAQTHRAKEALPLPDKPSIAVLPFENLSGDRKQDYFADGMVEEIITALSRRRWLFVIARNSSFAYRGRAVDVKQIGRELGVRYVLEGSVRKAGNRVRITGQLIDTSTGAHLWADRFDGVLEDVFDLQDQVTSSVVGAIAPKLEEAEIERSRRKPTESLDAYDFYLRGLAVMNQLSREATDVALRMFTMARERDPIFALAYAYAAWSYTQRKANGWMVDPVEETAEAARLARRAAELGKDDATALCFGGLTLGYVLGDVEDAAAFIGRALALDPNMAAAWFASGYLKLGQGELEMAIDHTSRAMRLSPLDTATYLWQTRIGLAHFCAGRYDKAVFFAENVLRDQPTYGFALRVVAASHALAGRSEQSQRAMARLRQSAPQLRVSNLGDVISPSELLPEHRARYIEGLRLAGLPE